ncbi:MAG: cation:proton antiporter, partial [Muribaculaceae bacterium]|nr:cation:proton antiporter [Muribaculaceae bacterium]
LLALAVAMSVQRTGEFSLPGMLWLMGKLVAYCAAVQLIYPPLTRYFLRHFNDRVTQFVYILAMVFLAASAAQAIGLEAVLGAFLAGLTLNKFVPNTSPLMSRIEFVGNALFIPYFLIGVGMMIDLRVIARGGTLLMAANMILVATATKWLAAWITQKIYGMSGSDRRVMFGLTAAHTAVALAVVTIGYNFGLMDEEMLNGTVLMILITCAVAPMVTSGAAARIKIAMLDRHSEEQQPDAEAPRGGGNTLVTVSDPATSLELMELAMMIHHNGAANRLYALHVRNDNTPAARATGSAAMELAIGAAATVDMAVTPLERFDLNVATGVANTISERDISTVVMGLHRRSTMIDSFFGPRAEHLLQSTTRQIILSRCFNPLATLRRLVVWVPPQAEYESGFRQWVTTLGRLASTLGSRMVFLCKPSINGLISGVLRRDGLDVRHEFRAMEQWDDFVVLANRILDDDLLTIILARPGSISHTPEVQQMPLFLKRYFSQANLLIVFPEQNGTDGITMSFIDPIGSETLLSPSPLTRLINYLGNLPRRISRHRRPPRIHPD